MTNMKNSAFSNNMKYLAISKTSITIWRQIKARWTHEPREHAALHTGEYPDGEQLSTAPYVSRKWSQEIHNPLKWQLEWIWQSKDKGCSDG